MSYLLKKYDTNLLEFEFIHTMDSSSVNILKVYENDKKLLPLDCEIDNASLFKWLKNRTIPANRAYVRNFLARNGLNEKDTEGIIRISKGLSLNDVYWVVDSEFDGKFDDYNLYDNRFSRVLSLIAFTGYGSYVGTTFRSSPEFTTGGMLAKCWRRENGKIILYKAGTEGFANSGLEPYSEFYAYQIAEKMGLRAVEYGLSKWKGKLCSTCELFNDKSVSFVAAGKLIKSGGIDAVLDYYRSLGKELYDDLIDMFVFDAVVYNEDRHLGNFGFLVDNRTNKIIRTAPLYDHGLSLFCYAMQDDLLNIEKYASTRSPALYRSFDEFTKSIITDRQKKMLAGLADFHFVKHSRYNWPEQRVKIIEEFIHHRAGELLNS